jgi:hypothetical protein
LYYSTGQALSPLRARGPSGLAARGEGRPFIPPAELGGILAYFYKEKYSFWTRSRSLRLKEKREGEWFGIRTKMRGKRSLGERLIEGRIGVHTLPKKNRSLERDPVNLNG